MRRLLAPLAGLALLAGSSGCGALGEAQGGSGPDGALRVTATTNFLAETAERIGGDRVHVTALMGPGVDPHLYRASAGDVDALGNADVALRVGLELESKMNEVFEGLARRGVTVVEVAGAVPRERLLAGQEQGEEFDPHVWFDPSAWLVGASAIADAFATADPDGAAAYEANLAELVADAEAVEAEGRELVERIPPGRRVLVTSHDAFRYLGRAFGLEVVGIQGLSTATEATTRDIRRVADLVVDRGIPAVFVESSVPRQTIEAVRAAVRREGGEVSLGGELYSDAAGEAGTAEGTWLGMVRANLVAISEALS